MESLSELMQNVKDDVLCLEISNIVWACDDEAQPDLPSIVYLPADLDDDMIAERLSDDYDFLVEAFCKKEVTIKELFDSYILEKIEQIPTEGIVPNDLAIILQVIGICLLETDAEITGHQGAGKATYRR